MIKNSHIDIGIGYVSIHENYLIMVVNQGETIEVKHNKILIDLAETFYKNKDFVYITNRVNSYAVDPAIYFETKKIKTLIGFSVVSKKEIAINNALLEKLFFDKPFETFKQIDEAIHWANKLCEASN
ncbi:hypothetical protein [Lacinutrix jangbogonensis]|uniref:hypothetical protein n=1 Tax=Lacinutrix jangbogonensis TaxID=1469557 RepID=UPI00068C55FE|nr:hypothetical protein [Lacinutrix jangbogonensis]